MILRIALYPMLLQRKDMMFQKRKTVKWNCQVTELESYDLGVNADLTTLNNKHREYTVSFKKGLITVFFFVYPE